MDDNSIYFPIFLILFSFITLGVIKVKAHNRLESLDPIVLSCQSCLVIFNPYSLNCGQLQELATPISEVPHSWQLLCFFCNVRAMLVGSDMHCICCLLHILLLPFSVGE